MTDNESKPCLVETAQGFSIKYKERFLYSKYNPAKNIVQKIEQMQILPGTVFLVCSPVLEYGIKELLRKLPQNCLVLLCEADKDLYAFAQDKNNLSLYTEFLDKPIWVSEKELYNLPVILQKSEYEFHCGIKKEIAGNFRRVIRIDFSAGFQFNEEFYIRLEGACVNSIKQFWTNRFTLAKFGRKYSRNMFQNLSLIDKAKPLSDFIKKIEKPVVVFGAGESSEEGIRVLSNKREQYFILCADTAFSMLMAHGIVPDGIVVDEAQSVISQSFIGSRKTAEKNGITVFQSLCSLPHVAGKRFSLENTCFYGTEYASNTFFESLKKCQFFPPVIPAFGSVGITAFILGCLFRKDNNVPLFYYGLDFAYSTGKTHARGTPAHKRSLRNTNRIQSLENLTSCFGMNVIRLSDNSPFPWTTPVLAGYAETFRQVREQSDVIVHSIFDSYLQKINKSECKNYSFNDFILNERAALMDLRDLLSGKKDLSETERSEKIKEYLENRQYLYLHFPDGYKMSMELNFLKRVRSEIDGFLKIMQNP